MAVESYDDGTVDVRGGLTGTVERVIVVGAGIAGLTVANALGHAGVECAVLEARERIGGRLHTIDLGGSPVDLGGSWIHHPIGNPMREFADAVGISCRDGDVVAQLGGYDCATGRRLTRDEVQANLAVLYEDFPEEIEGIRKDLGADASVAEAIHSFLTSAALPPLQERQARQGLRAVIEAEAADLPERQSLRWMWNELEYDGDYFGDLPGGGYRSIVDAMAAGVDARLGWVVRDVEVSAAGVRVTSRDGDVEEGTHAVVTVPLGVLKQGAPRFEPPLPPERLAVIERLGFGRLEKVALHFEEPFWRDQGLSHVMLFPSDPTQSTVWALDLDAFGAGPTYLAFIFHSEAERVRATAENPADAWVFAMLNQALGGSCPQPTAVVMTSWGDDPFAGGAYTHIPPGASPADLDLLGEPVGGRLLFAGEHTQSARVAYADGALTSGIREAKRLLNSPTVLLG